MARRRVTIGEEVGARLRAWREQEGRSLSDVAREAERIARHLGNRDACFRRNMVWRIEEGAEHTPSWRLEALALALDHSLRELYRPFGPERAPTTRGADCAA